MSTCPKGGLKNQHLYSCRRNSREYLENSLPIATSYSAVTCYESRMTKAKRSWQEDGLQVCYLAISGSLSKAFTLTKRPTKPSIHIYRIVTEPTHDPLHTVHLNIHQILALALTLTRIVLRILAALLILTLPLLLPLPLIILIQNLGRNPIKQLLRINPQQLPRQIQTLKDIPLLIRALRHKRLLKLIQELQGQLILRRQGLLADDGFHGGCVAPDGVFGVELVGDVAVVLARAALADGGFHEAREGGEDVDGWVDAFVGEAAVDEDLAFGDVACQVGNGVRDVCVGVSGFLAVGGL